MENLIKLRIFREFPKGGALGKNDNRVVFIGNYYSEGLVYVYVKEEDIKENKKGLIVEDWYRHDYPDIKTILNNLECREDVEINYMTCVEKRFEICEFKMDEAISGAVNEHKDYVINKLGRDKDIYIVGNKLVIKSKIDEIENCICKEVKKYVEEIEKEYGITIYMYEIEELIKKALDNEDIEENLKKLIENKTKEKRRKNHIERIKILMELKERLKEKIEEKKLESLEIPEFKIEFLVNRILDGEEVDIGYELDRLIEKYKIENEINERRTFRACSTRPRPLHIDWD